MDGHLSATALPGDVAAAVAGARLVGAPVSDTEDEWAFAGRGAIRIAREVGARVILADVSTRSWFVTPYATGGPAADIEGFSSGEGALSRAELELLGRHYLVAHLEEAAAAGVKADAWLATRPGIGTLDMFLHRFPEIDVIVTPPLDDPSLGQWLGGDTIDGIRTRVGDRTLILAHANGRLTVDRPLANGRPADL